MENLWNFDENINLESPVEILKDQIQYLEKLTDKCVSAALVEDKNETNEFQYDFVINSPYLPNYSFKAFTIKCSPIFYPVTIECERNIAVELGMEVQKLGGYTFGNDIVCNNSEEFKTELRKILGSKYMNQVVAAVKVMAKSYL